jgi:hypothetical protein
MTEPATAMPIVISERITPIVDGRSKVATVVPMSGEITRRTQM